MKKQKGFTAIELCTALLIAVIVIGGIGGWIANIVKLAHSDFGHVTGMLALRCIGVIVAPLGSVLGFC